MKRDQLTYGLVGVLIGGVLVWFLAVSAVNNSVTGIMQMMGIRGGYQGTMINSNTIDAHFIEQMIPHHEDAVTMAKLAEQNAKQSEIKTLAKNIIDSQSKEIDQMKSWYKEWFGKDVPQNEQTMGMHGMQQQQGMHMGMMGNTTDMERLSGSSDFDRSFIEEMIPHHQMAVMMAAMLKNGTKRPEMKKLAEDIMSAQNDEISQMRDWYKVWYQ